MEKSELSRAVQWKHRKSLIWDKYFHKYQLCSPPSPCQLSTFLRLSEKGVWLHEKNPKQQGGLFQRVATLWGETEPTLLGRVTCSIFSIIWTTRTAPAALLRREMIESPGISVKNRENAPTGPQVNTKTDNCSYLHTITRRQHQTDLERESWNKRVEKKILSGIQTEGSVLMKLGVKASAGSWRN